MHEKLFSRSCLWVFLLLSPLGLYGQSYVTYGSAYCGTLAEVFVDYNLLTDYNAVRLSSGHLVNANSTNFNLPGGEYALEVQQSAPGWDTLLLFIIPEINEPVPIIVRTAQPTCETASGAIFFGAESGMNSEFLYSLVPSGSAHFFTSNQNYPGLAAGAYELAMHVIGNSVPACIAYKIVVLSAADEIGFMADVTPASNCFGNDGSVSVAAEVFGNYEFRIEDGSWSTNNFFGGLSAGTYSIQVRPSGSSDGSCVATQTILVSQAAPEVIQLTLDVTLPTACGRTDGQLFITNSLADTLVFRINGGQWQEETLFGGLPAGTYTVEARGDFQSENGCYSSATVSISEPPAPSLQLAYAPPTICGGFDGLVNLFVTPVPAPGISYDYSVSFGGNTSILSSFQFDQLGSGIDYIFTVEPSGNNKAACRVASNLSVPFNNVPEISLETDNPTFCTQDNGSIQIVESSSHLIQSYLVGGNGFSLADNRLDAIGAGSYTFTVYPAALNVDYLPDPCVVNVAAELVSPAITEIEVFDHAPSACGVNDGELEIAELVGDPQQVYEFSLDDQDWQEAMVFFGLAEGSYPLYVRPKNIAGSEDCKVMLGPFNLAAPELPELSVTSDGPTACGRADGSIVLHGGEEETLEYSLNGGSFVEENVFSSLFAGSYEIRYRPKNSLDPDCTRLEWIILQQPAAPTLSLIATDPSACGRSDGSVLLQASGAGEFEYAFEDGAFGSQTDFTALSAGEHAFSVRPTNSLEVACVTRDSVILQQPAAPTLSMTATEPSACGRSDGSVILQASGADEFEYAFEDGAFGSQTDFTALSDGEHAFSVRPTNSLEAACVTQDSVILQQPAAPILSLTATDPSACGRSDGSVLLQASGAGEFEYAFEDGAFGSQTDFTALSAGEHAFSVRPTNSLEAACVTWVSVILQQPAAPTLSLTATDPNACGRSDGSVILQASGAGEFEYAFEDGAFGSQTDFTALSAGEHAFSVRPTNSLEAACVTQDSVILQQPAAPTLSLIATDPSACGRSDGSVILQGSGAGEFEYAFEDGAFGSQTDFSALSAGEHAFSVRPTNSLEAACVTRDSVILQQPAAPTLSLTATDPSACGRSDGSVLLQASGAGEFEYAFEDGAFGSQTDFSALSAGEHAFSVRPTNSLEAACVTRDSVILQQPAAPILSLTATDPSACGRSDGSVILQGSGADEFEYAFEDGVFGSQTDFIALSAGEHSFSVRPTNSLEAACVTRDSVILQQPAAPTLSLIATDPSACGRSDGSVILQGSGADEFEYAFEDGAFGSQTDFTALSAGEHAFSVRPTNSLEAACVTQDSVILQQPAAPILSLTATDPSACGLADGDLLVSGSGSGPFDYFVTGFGWVENTEFNNLTAGEYSVYVRPHDTESPEVCTDSTLVLLTTPALPELLTNADQPSSCGELDGIITLSPSSFQEGMEYRLLYPNGDSTEWGQANQFEDLIQGIYFAQLRLNGSAECIVNATIDLSNSSPPLAVLSSDPPTSCGLTNGNILVQAPPTGNYEFRLSTSENWQAENDFGGLAGNISYSVFIRGNLDDLCQGNSQLFLAAGPLVAVQFVRNLPSDCGANDGFFIPLTTGGDPADEYAFRANITGVPPADFVPLDTFRQAVATTYEVAVSMNGAEHCLQSYLVDLQVSEIPMLNLLSQDNPTYCGSEDGRLEVLATNPGDYEYSLDDPMGDYQTTGIFDQLLAGNYTVFIQPVQAYGTDCLGSQVFSLIEPNPIDFTVNVNPPTGCGSADGSFVVTPEVSPGDFTYELRDSMNSLIETNVTGQFFGLIAGTYHLAQLTNGLEICATSQTLTLNAVGAPQVEVEQIDHPSQCGLSDGSITITNLDGGDYRYALFPEGPFQLEPYFLDLEAGVHTVYARRSDAVDNFCAAVLQLILSAADLPEISASYLLENPFCVQDNASIVVAAPGPEYEAVRYRLQLPGGAFTDWQLLNVFNGLAAGVYQVQVEFNGEISCIIQSLLDIPNGSGVTAVPPVLLSIIDENICNGTSGQITLQSGDALSSFFSFDGGMTFSQATNYSGLSPGNYEILTAVSASGCGQSVPIIVTIASINHIDLTALTIEDPFSCLIPDGSIIFDATTGSFEYSIDGGSSWSDQAIFEQLGSGQYQLGVRSENQLCETLGSELIDLEFINRPEVTGVDFASASSCDGVGAYINIAANTTGFATLKYSINNGIDWQVSPYFEEPEAGIYQVVVRSENEAGEVLCLTNWPAEIAIEAVQVGVPPAMNLTASNPPSACGESNGSFTFTAVDGVELEYSIDEGLNWQDNGFFDGLPAGWHILSIRETAGSCSYFAVDSSLLLAENEALITGVSISPLTDCGTADANVLLTVVNVNSDTRYSIDGGVNWSAENSFSDLGEGTVLPAVRQSSGQCLSFWGSDLSIDLPADVNLSLASISAVSDCGLMDGSIVLSDGNPNWAYRLSGTDDWVPTVTFNDLLAGSYLVEGRHADFPACRDTLEIGIEQEIAYLAGVPEVLTWEGNACLELLPAVAISGGVPDGEPVYYQLSNGTWEAGPLVINLPAGTYSLRAARATDGCGGGPSATVNLVSIDILASPMVFSLSPTHCDSSNGQISVTLANPEDAALTYSIDGGESWQADTDFSGLTAGNYQVLARNEAAGCLSEVSEVISLSPTNVVSIDAVAVTQADGCGDVLAGITIETNYSGVEYSINGGAQWQSTDTFSGLPAGNYSIAVKSMTDTSGSCATYWGPQVVIDSVEQFVAPTLTLTSLIVPTSCNQANGEIGFDYTGNTDYEFSIDGGLSWSATNIYSGLASGNYVLMARPLTGACVFNNLLDISLAATNTPAINEVVVSGLTDCGMMDASLEIIAENVTMHTEFSIDGGENWQGSANFGSLSEGSYSVQLRDTFNGCAFAWLVGVVIDTVAVPILADLAIEAPTDCGLSDGSITVNFALGSAPGSLAELNGPLFALTEGGVISALPAGVYNLTIMNAVGLCRTLIADTLLLPEPDTVLIDNIARGNPSACGTQDGFIRVYPADQAWEYSIDGGGSYQDFPLFTALAAGTYLPLARNRNHLNCKFGAAETILSGESLEISPELNAEFLLLDNCSPMVSGRIELNGTTEGLLYSINGGISWSDEPVFTGVDLTGELIFITLANSDTSCFSYDHFQIVRPQYSTGAALLLDTIINASCGETSPGIIRVSGIGFGVLNYQWSDGQYGTEVNGLVAGAYTVSLTDAAGCADSMTVEVMSAGGEVPEGVNFLLPQQALINSTVRLIDISTSYYSEVSWDFDSLAINFIRARDRSVFVSFTELGVITVGLTVLTADGCLATVYKQIEIVATVAELDVQPFNGNNGGFLNFTVYPNPTTSNFWVEVSMANEAPLEISLHDPNGNELHISEHGASLEHLVNLTLEDQPAGAYPLLVRSGQNYQYAYVIRQ